MFSTPRRKRKTRKNGSKKGVLIWGTVRANPIIAEVQILQLSYALQCPEDRGKSSSSSSSTGIISQQVRGRGHEKRPKDAARVNVESMKSTGSKCTAKKQQLAHD